MRLLIYTDNTRLPGAASRLYDQPSPGYHIARYPKLAGVAGRGVVGTGLRFVRPPGVSPPLQSACLATHFVPPTLLSPQ
jgi:hypothetical protein